MSELWGSCHGGVCCVVPAGAAGLRFVRVAVEAVRVAGQAQNTPSEAFSGDLTGSATLPGLELPPASLRLSQGVWGFDPSTVRMSVAVVQRGLEHVDTLSLPRARDNHRRYSVARRALEPFVAELASRFPPSHVFVEQPFAKSKHVHPSSYFVIGALLCALGDVLPAQCEIRLIDPMSWKSRALGKGRGFARPDEYMAWAREVAGYRGVIEDEAAAVGVATGGAILLGQEQSARAA